MPDGILFGALFVSLFLTLHFFFNDWKAPIKSALKKGRQLSDWNRIERSLEEKIFKTDDFNKMKYRISTITGTKKTRTERLKDRINHVVLNPFHAWSYLSYSLATLVCVIIGVWLGRLMNNSGLTIVLSTVFATFPYLYLTYRIKHIERDKDRKLLIVMGNIQATYLNRDSFVLAVKEILDTIPAPLHSHFKLFVDEMLYFGANQMDDAAMRLGAAVNNHFFTEFIQLAIQAEKGASGLKYTMKSVPADYQRFLEKNEKYLRIVEDYNVQFVIRIVLFPFTIGFLKLISEDYYRIITENIFGKFMLFVMAVVYVVAAFIYMRYNKDIKFEL